MSGARGRFRCSTPCTGFFSCLPSSLSGSARGSTPPSPTHSNCGFACVPCTCAYTAARFYSLLSPVVRSVCALLCRSRVGGRCERKRRVSVRACQLKSAKSRQPVAPRRQKVMRVTGFARERPLIRNDYHVARSLRGSIALSVGCEPRLLARAGSLLSLSGPAKVYEL